MGQAPQGHLLQAEGGTRHELGSEARVSPGWPPPSLSVGGPWRVLGGSTCRRCPGRDLGLPVQFGPLGTVISLSRPQAAHRLLHFPPLHLSKNGYFTPSPDSLLLGLCASSLSVCLQPASRSLSLGASGPGSRRRNTHGWSGQACRWEGAGVAGPGSVGGRADGGLSSWPLSCPTKFVGMTSLWP